jgi:1-acyl-sn-glycerol-3-phosphate acyltransferase
LADACRERAVVVVERGVVNDRAELKPANADAAEQLLGVVADLRRELRGGQARRPTLDDDLERELGIDSLARMELMLRLEQSFAVRLPEAQVQAAQTPRDLLRALAGAQPTTATSAATEPIADAAAPPARPREATAGPVDAQTLNDVLAWRAQQQPDSTHITLLHGDEDSETTTILTHHQLFERAQTVAAALRAHGVQPRETVALMLPTGLAFFEAFAGILLAGGIPIPIYPPLRASQVEDHLRRQARILENGQAVLLITDPRVLPAARVLRAGSPVLRGVVTADELVAAREQPVPLPAPLPAAAPRHEDIAFLQYTSGSTGQPKGVVMTHANLLANIRAMAHAIDAGSNDVFASWLPLYHDMGLIGAWMGSLYVGMPLVLMPPQSFLARPSRWLWAIHRYRATLSAAPNFAYEILANRVPDTELRGLDLSCWRMAFNGAEPVRASTVQRFAQRFAAHGFDARAVAPVYGLAECGLGLAFPPPRRGVRIDAIARNALHDTGRAEPVAAGAPNATPIVSCGAPLPGHQLRAVDALGHEVPERTEGRLQFRGPSATSGYFRNADATAELFDGDWLNTGDVGYLFEGEVYLTSRVKDLIIRGGHNIHPYDLEEAIGNLPGARRGCVAVFGANDPASGTERIVVLAETREQDAPAKEALRARIAELAIALLGAPADDIVLAPPHVVLKTSSGKIRRAACRELYEQGALQAPRQRTVAMQLARLWAGALRARLRIAAGAVVDALYAAYAWSVFALAACAAVLVVAWLPGLHRRQRGARALARAVLRLSGLPVAVEGAEHLAGSAPRVAVANHASYIDWLLLMALLPPAFRFVAKRELRENAFTRVLLQRVGTRFVARDDSHQGVEDAKTLVQAAQQGESLVFFPEGTLGRAPGLRDFHLGAFVVSAESGLPVLPLALRGTRSVLRDGSWWLRRQAVRVQVHAPVAPAGAQWADAVALRDAARRLVASGCGEPDLSEPQRPA